MILRKRRALNPGERTLSMFFDLQVLWHCWLNRSSSWLFSFSCNGGSSLEAYLTECYAPIFRCIVEWYVTAILPFYQGIIFYVTVVGQENTLCTLVMTPTRNMGTKNRKSRPEFQLPRAPPKLLALNYYIPIFFFPN